MVRCGVKYANEPDKSKHLSRGSIVVFGRWVVRYSTMCISELGSICSLIKSTHLSCYHVEHSMVKYSKIYLEV